jgi:hypothetical protein
VTQRGLMAGAAVICSLTLAASGTAAAGARGAEDAGYERARAAADGPAAGVQSAWDPCHVRREATAPQPDWPVCRTALKRPLLSAGGTVAGALHGAWHPASLRSP